MVFDSLVKKDWVNNLPFVKRIMNSQVHSSVGVSPSQLVFGNSVNHDANIVLPKETKEPGTYSDYMDNLLKVQSQLITVAQNTQHALDNFHVAQRTQSTLTSFPINSYVLCEYKVKKPSKYHTNLHGPYRVVNHNERKSEYTVQHLVTNKLYDYHAKLLREFKHDDNSSPYEAAKHDDEYDEVVEGLPFSSPLQV